MELLTGLRGVGVPMASAILTLLDPRRYGVLDIRAWQLLFAIRSVSANRAARASPSPSGSSTSPPSARTRAALHVTARAIEYTLLCHSQGLLYRQATNASRAQGHRSYSAARRTTRGTRSVGGRGIVLQ